MTRSVAREIAMHLSFELGFTNVRPQALLDARLQRDVFESLSEECPLYKDFPNRKQEDYIRQLVSGVGEHGAELDSYIERYAVGWRFSRISRVASAIMRVSMYEILYMPDIPPAAAINEAVELSKYYEEPETTSFINGILGKFLRTEGAAFGIYPTSNQRDETSKKVEASQEYVSTDHDALINTAGEGTPSSL